MNLVHFAPVGGIPDIQAARLEAEIERAIASGKELGSRVPQIRAVGSSLQKEIKDLQSAIILLIESLNRSGVLDIQQQCSLLVQFLDSASKLADMAENYTAS
ncbi:hypothetical protein ACQKQD_31210 [Methylobacterium sp. NPDC080182]|uniref:hypothetical protein n=1 Tax=Methylobacterium sp. NPDC080182 TaxID=3390590 RepID=UPI003D0091E4